MAPTLFPAPKRPRLRKDMTATTLPPGARALVDAMVGTFYGSTRSEVLRFIVISWLTTNIAAINAVANKGKR